MRFGSYLQGYHYSNSFSGVHPNRKFGMISAWVERPKIFRMLGAGKAVFNPATFSFSTNTIRSALKWASPHRASHRRTNLFSLEFKRARQVACRVANPHFRHTNAGSFNVTLLSSPR